jgi:peptidoglycan/xylan/chitin deacetylase (PgdA/CDA1 family)
VHLFVRDSGNGLRHRTWSGSWGTTEVLGGNIADSVGAAAVGSGRLLVIGRSRYGVLSTTELDAGNWSGWRQPVAAAPLPALPQTLTGRIVTRLPVDKKLVALTFDGGSGAQSVDQVLRTLAETGTPASTFLTGAFVRDHPAAANRLVQAGLRVGNHTDTHPHMTKISLDLARQQVRAARTSITKVTGAEPRPLFRFPYGEWSSSRLSMVNDMGYVAVGWTVDTLGWKGRSEGISPQTVVDRVVANLRPGEIVLMHLGASPDGSTVDADALPAVIREVQARGYRFVTLRMVAGW